MAGKDVLGKARTGSGKTLGFGLPMLARLAEMGRPEPRRPMGLVLVPTRELAMQVGDALEPYAHSLELSIRLIAGGLSMSKQIMSMERGVHLLVATPGRLADLMRRGHVILDKVAIAVLDEADHMAEMGFAEEIAEILALTPADGQRLLFSATLDGVVDDLVSRFMHEPVLHDVTSGTDEPTQRHVMLAIPPHEKYQTATRIAARDGRTICFVRTKLAADRVAAEMREAGVLAVALHGDRSQYERNLAMTEFRAGRLPVLVATDVAARGIHVDAVDLVLQIDPPADYRDYTHRSGRTGRAGADGLAVMMVLPHQRGQARRLLERANITAEEAAFRVIDAAALEQIDELTGGREPSWVPVQEPVGPPRASRFGGRDSGREGGRGRGPRAFDDRGPRPQRRNDDRPERFDGPPRGSRPDWTDRPARAPRAEWSDRPARAPRGEWSDRPARQVRPDTGSRPHWEDDAAARAKAAQAEEAISRREAAILARERELAQREAQLAQREASMRETPSKPERGRGGEGFKRASGDRFEKPSRSGAPRSSWGQRDEPRGYGADRRDDRRNDRGNDRGNDRRAQSSDAGAPQGRSWDESRDRQSDGFRSGGPKRSTGKPSKASGGKSAGKAPSGQGAAKAKKPRKPRRG